MQPEQARRGAADIRQGGGRHQLPAGMAGQSGSQPGGGPAHNGRHGYNPNAHRAAQGRPSHHIIHHSYHPPLISSTTHRAAQGSPSHHIIHYSYHPPLISSTTLIEQYKVGHLVVSNTTDRAVQGRASHRIIHY